MEQSVSTICAVRYGYGFGSSQHAQTADDLLRPLRTADHSARHYPIYRFGEAAEMLADYGSMNKREKAQGIDLSKQRMAFRKKMASLIQTGVKNTLMRTVFSSDQFRERLVHFWLDHFTVSAKNLRISMVILPMIEEAIRPNIAGRFEDMLVDAILHPAMLSYLDQNTSLGPNSVAGKRTKRGLNENLAREMLELHTLGVAGSYTQSDVRQLAELLTGLRNSKDGTFFSPRWAEPGTEQIFGKVYGGTPAKLDHIKVFLRDLAVREDTAKHIARKLAVHFVSMTPSDDFVDQIATRFLETGGDLFLSYKAMLTHPEAFSALGGKVKTPFEFITSGLRALHVKPEIILGANAQQFRRNFSLPMQLMGQRPFRPTGPDGWPEEPEAWITPSALAGRLQWAMQATQPLVNKLDPRDFMASALGELASEPLEFATARSANKQEALALVLASPEFNRR